MVYFCPEILTFLKVLNFYLFTLFHIVELYYWFFMQNLKHGQKHKITGKMQINKKNEKTRTLKGKLFMVYFCPKI